MLATYGTSGDFPQALKFTYNSVSQSAWLLPGMVVDVNRTFPTALGNYIVEEISSSLDALTVWRHSVTLRYGQGEVSETFERSFLDAARVPIVSPPVRATFELDVTNVGQAVGLQPNRYTVQLPPGVKDMGILSWDWWFPTDPPTGADFNADILVNGVSIFPALAANKVVVAAASTAVASGIKFLTNNRRLVEGDQISINVTQVGSTLSGKYSLGHLNFVV